MKNKSKCKENESERRVGEKVETSRRKETKKGGRKKTNKHSESNDKRSKKARNNYQYPLTVESYVEYFFSTMLFLRSLYLDNESEIFCVRLAAEQEMEIFE